MEISDTIEEEKNRVEAFSGSVDKVLSNMDEIQECTNVNEAVSKDLKKEIAKFSVIYLILAFCLTLWYYQNYQR